MVTEKQRAVLLVLAGATEWLSARHITDRLDEQRPDRSQHQTISAVRSRLNRMVLRGWVRLWDEQSHPSYLYRITDKGYAALEG